MESIKKFVVVCGVVAGLLGLSTSAQAIINIDTFDVGTLGPTGITANSGTPTDTSHETGLDLTHVIGGSRDATVTWISGTLSARMNINPPPAVLGMSSDTGTTGNFELQYDNDGAGLGGIDLTQGGTSPGFVVFFTSADAGAATTVTLTDTGGDTLTRTLLTAGPGFLFFQYALFAGAGDITDINVIHFIIEGQEDGDYQISLIQSRDRPGDEIPEPVSAALGGLGLLALARRRYTA